MPIIEEKQKPESVDSPVAASFQADRGGHAAAAAEWMLRLPEGLDVYYFFYAQVFICR
jgi:hypothetical protein